MICLHRRSNWPSGGASHGPAQTTQEKENWLVFKWSRYRYLCGRRDCGSEIAPFHAVSDLIQGRTVTLQFSIDPEPNQFVSKITPVLRNLLETLDRRAESARQILHHCAGGSGRSRRACSCCGSARYVARVARRRARSSPNRSPGADYRRRCDTQERREEPRPRGVTQSSHPIPRTAADDPRKAVSAYRITLAKLSGTGRRSWKGPRLMVCPYSCHLGIGSSRVSA